MSNRPPDPRDRKVFAQPEAERLLARASELDVVRRAGSDVSELRAAAAEAGISSQAFDAALAEMRGGADASSISLASPRSRTRHWPWIAVAALVMLFGGMVIVPRGAGVVAVEAVAATTTEEALLLRCVAPGEAAELVRPLLQNPWNTLVTNPEQAPRVLRVRGTPSKLAAVKAELAKYEGDGSAACPVAPAAR